MTNLEKVLAGLIHLVVPAIGIVFYLRVLRRIRQEGHLDALALPVLILFFIYGGLVMILLTAVCWEWSGAASLGLVFEVFVAPVMAAVIGWTFRDRKARSGYHAAVYRWSWRYFVVLVLVLCSTYAITTCRFPEAWQGP